MGFMMIVIPKGYESAAPDAVPGAEAVAKTRPVHLGAVQSCETGYSETIQLPVGAHLTSGAPCSMHACVQTSASDRTR
jgi:hypothetical protein